MSERTSCNYHNLKRLRKEVKESGNVLISKEATHPNGGTDFFSLTQNENEENLNEKEFRDKHFIAWMWEITDHCVC